jgi:hypothetical protein
MDTSYKLKYLKYKKKYLDLYQDILTYSRNSDISKEISEHANKNKYLSLRDKYLNIFNEGDFSLEKSSTLNKNKYLDLQKKIYNFNQFGGAAKNIIFGCTNLNKDSTYYEHFDLINDTINKLIPKEEIKQPYFVRTGMYGKPEEELLSKMKENNYIITEKLINDKCIIDYINSEFISKGTTIDVLVLAQCNDFLSTFLPDPDTYNRYNIRYYKTPRIIDYKDLFDLLKVNLLSVYKSVDYIINIYYNLLNGQNNGLKQNIEYNFALVTSGYLLIHHIFCEIFYKLFELIEEGVYRKKPGITDADYNRICDEIYRNNIDKCFAIIKNKELTIDKKKEEIINNFTLKDIKYINIIIDIYKGRSEFPIIEEKINKFIIHNQKYIN